MNIDAIRQAVNSDADDETKRLLIMAIIAQDKHAIGDVLTLIDIERKQNAEMIADLNLLVSRYDVCLKNDKLMNRTFLSNNTADIYEKWKGRISHLFDNA